MPGGRRQRTRQRRRRLLRAAGAARPDRSRILLVVFQSRRGTPLCVRTSGVGRARGLSAMSCAAAPVAVGASVGGRGARTRRSVVDDRRAAAVTGGLATGSIAVGSFSATGSFTGATVFFGGVGSRATARDVGAAGSLVIAASFAAGLSFSGSCRSGSAGAAITGPTGGIADAPALCSIAWARTVTVRCAP